MTTEYICPPCNFRTFDEEEWKKHLQECKNWSTPSFKWKWKGLPSGQKTTVGEALTNSIAKGTLMLGAEPEKSKVIDIEEEKKEEE